MWRLLCTESIKGQGPTSTSYLFSGTKNRYGFDDHTTVYLAIIQREKSKENVGNGEAQGYGGVQRILTRNVSPDMEFGLVAFIEVTYIINERIGVYWLMRCTIGRERGRSPLLLREVWLGGFGSVHAPVGDD